MARHILYQRIKRIASFEILSTTLINIVILSEPMFSTRSFINFNAAKKKKKKKNDVFIVTLC